MIKRLKFKLWYWKFGITSRISALIACIKAMKPYKPLKKVESTPEHTEAMMEYFFPKQERAIEQLKVDNFVCAIDKLIAEYKDKANSLPKYVVVNASTMQLLYDYGMSDIWPELEMIISDTIGENIEVIGCGTND